MLNQFKDWSDVLFYVDTRSEILYYQAPLDTVPNICCVVKRFKNGKLRVAVGPYKFTADRDHVGRFSWKS
jgi:hypothetical protein